MTDTVIYCRISRDREGAGVGVERQEADCRALAARLGLPVSRVFVDNDVSAYSGKRRPAYEEMMALAEAGRVGTILAYSNSRLTRRMLELERLIAAHDRHGVRFHTVASGQDDLSTADGRMVAHIKASVDEAESERIGERTRRAKQQARDDGRWPGGWRAYGMTDKGTTVVPDEAAILEEMTGALLDGRAVISLVRELNRRRVPTSTGKEWTARSLCRVLRRPHPSIDPDVTAAVNLLLDDPDRKTTPGPERRWLLTGIAICGVCDDTLRGSGSSMGSGRGTYAAYRCRTGKHVVVSATTLDKYVTTLAVARLARPDIADLLAPSEVDTTQLRREARTLRAQLDALADDLGLDVRTLARRASALQKRLDEVQAELAGAARSSPLAAFDGRDPVDVWFGLDLERRRGVVDTLMRITVNTGARGLVKAEHRWRADLPAFDPRRVTVEWH